MSAFSRFHQTKPTAYTGIFHNFQRSSWLMRQIKKLHYGILCFSTTMNYNPLFSIVTWSCRMTQFDENSLARINLHLLCYVTGNWCQVIDWDDADGGLNLTNNKLIIKFISRWLSLNPRIKLSNKYILILSMVEFQNNYDWLAHSTI